ncbi:STAS domain-containing protein [Kitasatospora sp. NPDC086791]|uniref:STAS domain-containing protein n=1 Tax=Kitasatospora sp. NPDC086791 TaxID=3155178 RepID=UPI003446932A
MRDDDLLRTSTGLFRGTAMVSLEGELDIATAPLVADAVVRALAARPRHLDLDVTALTFCDVAGLRALGQARRIANDHHAEFHLVGVRPRLRRILALLRATDLLPSPSVPAEGRVGAVTPEPLG